MGVNLQKSLLSALVCLIPCALGADSNQLDGSLSLFSVLAAVNAAGLEGGRLFPSLKSARQYGGDSCKNPQVLSELTNFETTAKPDVGKNGAVHLLCPRGGRAARVPSEIQTWRDQHRLRRWKAFSP